MSLPASWYAVQTRSRHEKLAAGFARGVGIETFLPLYRRRSARSDRTVLVDEPLFRGYFFVRVDFGSPERVKVLRAPGFVRWVTFGEMPTPVPDDQVESLAILVGQGTETVSPFPYLKAGQLVRVVAGPFNGVQGYVVESPEDGVRIVVSIELLGRSVSVKVDRMDVEPVFY